MKRPPRQRAAAYPRARRGRNGYAFAHSAGARSARHRLLELGGDTQQQILPALGGDELQADGHAVAVLGDPDRGMSICHGSSGRTTRTSRNACAGPRRPLAATAPSNRPQRRHPRCVAPAARQSDEKAHGPRRGPYHTATDRRVRQNSDVADPQKSTKIPANESDSEATAARLKIVVSPVRVRVSPSTKGLQHPCL
jgi:hypothetical protein